MNSQQYDIIVIGGGAIGLSAAYHCAQAQKRVLLLEQFEFINDMHSSKGNARFFRLIYSDVMLCNLARTSLALWRELENKSQQKLFDRTGVLFYGVGGEKLHLGDLTELPRVMSSLGIAYEEFDSRSLQKRFPVLNSISDETVGIYQEDAGILHAQKILQTLRKLAQENGADLHENESVKSVHSHQSDGLITVHTSRAKYQAQKAILAPGAWTNEILKHLDVKLNLEAWLMTYARYSIDSERYRYPMWCFFGNNNYSGLPLVAPSGQMKVLIDFTRAKYESPKDCSFEPDLDMVRLMNTFLKENFHGVAIEPSAVKTCFYTMTPDENLILDFVPGHENIVLFTGGTGQAFKFVPLLGHILSQLTLAGKTEYNIDAFSILRPGILA